MPLPAFLPQGTISYYDDRPSVKWYGGVREIRAAELETGKPYMDLIASEDGLMPVAWAWLKNHEGLTEPYETWKRGVAWLSDPPAADDDESDESESGEGGSPTGS